MEASDVCWGLSTGPGDADGAAVSEEWMAEGALGWLVADEQQYDQGQDVESILSQLQDIEAV
jgi:hypothetical protein